MSDYSLLLQCQVSHLPSTITQTNKASNIFARFATTYSATTANKCIDKYIIGQNIQFLLFLTLQFQAKFFSSII